MRKIENECVSCGLPCLGNSCIHRNVERFYCDKCEAAEEIYDFEGKELCIECIEELLKIEDAEYCEHCGEERTIYDYEGEKLCINCITEKLDRIDD